MCSCARSKPASSRPRECQAMRKRRIVSLSFLVAALLVGACTSSGVQQASGVAVPVSWTRVERSPPSDTPLVLDANAGIDHAWWKHFGDPTLDSLIAEALENNKSLQIA